MQQSGLFLVIVASYPPTRVASAKALQVIHDTERSRVDPSLLDLGDSEVTSSFHQNSFDWTLAITGRYGFVARRSLIPGGTLRVIACIETPEVIERILAHLATRETGAINDSRAPPLVVGAAQPPPPITDHLLTAPTGAPRPRCASPAALRPTPCLTRSHHCRLHNISSPRPRNVCARTDNVPDNDHASSTTPLLLQQRRSASYFAYPLPSSAVPRTRRMMDSRCRLEGANEESAGPKRSQRTPTRR